MEPLAPDGTAGFAGEAMAGERAERFLAMSAVLTGYGRVQLTGTGLTAAYLRAVDASLPGGVLDDLLGAFARPRARAGKRAAGDDRELGGVPAILDDPRLGPVARNVILLWYCGTWTALPDDWHAAYGASRADTTRVVSPQAYQGALQWAAAGAHPAGARPQGFGAWSAPPEPAPSAGAGA